MATVDLWLDDVRPAPDGWVHVKTVDEAKRYLADGVVRRASLDHDLGICDDCAVGTPEEWLAAHNFQSMPHCTHFGTGYDLVCWMEETGHWPTERPTVHSANPVGRAKMLVAIERQFGRTSL
jgi:hypothetical protein